MAVIRAFKAYRPRKDLTARIAELPYDVFSEAEAREIVKRDPYSFLRIDRAETQFPVGQDMYADEVYEKAASILNEMIRKGEFVQDSSPCLYVYEQTMNGRSQTGLVAASSVDDYLNGVIKKHEETRREKELDRIRHVDACSAQTGPIFLAYRENARIDELVTQAKEKEPSADFETIGDVRHSVWVISDPAVIREITELFAGIDRTYIADGHHRAASAVKTALMRRERCPDYTGDEEFNFFLSVLFPANQLKVLDYNRVLKTLGGMEPEELLQRIGEKATVERVGEKPAVPSKKGEVGLYLNDTWYRLNAKEETLQDDVVESLDVAWLQREILSPLFGIEDPTTDPGISFVGGIRGLSELERRCHTDCAAAFAMYPTDILELFAVADAGRLMPPKSTWFEPKLLSGLFIHKF